MCAQAQNVEERAYYSTNANEAVGQAASITIDGEFSDWNESMIISTGGANDVATAFKGGHENCVLDIYALYAAWDDSNLYIAWQMCNTTDVWAREGDGPLSDGGRVLDVPLAVALSVNPNSVSLSGKVTDGNGIWGVGQRLQFTSHVDHLLLMSGKVGLGEPALFKAVDNAGNTNYSNGCLLFKNNGISYKMKEGFQPSHLWRQKTNASDVTVVYDSENYENLMSADYTGKSHNTKYDSFYEIKIPLSVLGINREWLETYGIGCRVIATRGESGIDCMPHDPTVLDNVFGDYGSDPSTTHEKDDIDNFTYNLASIGHMRDIENIPTPDVPDTPDPEAPDTPETPADGNYVVYFKDNGSPVWSSVMTWIWDAGNNNKNYTGGTWPGQSMSKTTVDGTEYWKFTFTTTDNLSQPMIIFNNGNGGNGNQTADLVYENYAIYDRNGVIGYIKPNTAIDAIETASDITYNHLTVTATGDIMLYNTQGVLVAKGQNSITAPTAGLYIVVNGSTVEKAVLR